ncbi:hypothetical protein KIPB_010698, partial [Kipferlia bialata]
ECRAVTRERTLLREALEHHIGTPYQRAKERRMQVSMYMQDGEAGRSVYARPSNQRLNRTLDRAPPSDPVSKEYALSELDAFDRRLNHHSQFTDRVMGTRPEDSSDMDAE